MNGIADRGMELFGVAADCTGRNASKFDSTWSHDCRVAVISRKSADWMVQQHYLHKWPGVTVLRLGMFLTNVAVGCVIYALPPRETEVRYGGTTWELARLWIDDALPRNAETWLIAKSVKHIREYFKAVKILVSYADPSAGHRGTIYRAANWKDDGSTDERRATPRTDYEDADTGKVYSRRAHVPEGVEIVKRPRVSKHRFIYRLP